MGYVGDCRLLSTVLCSTTTVASFTFFLIAAFFFPLGAHGTMNLTHTYVLTEKGTEALDLGLGPELVFQVKLKCKGIFMPLLAY